MSKLQKYLIVTEGCPTCHEHLEELKRKGTKDTKIIKVGDNQDLVESIGVDYVPENLVVSKKGAKAMVCKEGTIDGKKKCKLVKKFKPKTIEIE